MRFRTLFSSATLLAPALLLAQTARLNTPFDKEHFADAEGLKAAQAAMKRGEAHFKEGGTHFSQALEEFEKAHAFNPDNADLNLKMGLCHLNGRFHHKALPYFEAAYALDQNLPRIHFLLGFGHQLNAEWDEAMVDYQLHKAVTSRTPDQEPLYNSADRRIVECQHGKALQANPVNGQVSNMGPAINSEVSDYGVLISADGERLMFTSRRANGTGGKVNKATNEYFEDIYGCSRSAQGWTTPVPLPVPVNSAGNDASVGLFNDGRTMIIYRDDAGFGDLFESTREGEGWSEPKSLGENINSPWSETSAWFSYDRKQLYFVSDREGGLGGQDIWVSRWDGEAKAWREAENLGPTINTYEDEDGVFVHPDGNSLYFSSKGHNCMGGYDVFKSTLHDGKWGAPTNLGWPVNSPDDDLFFVLTANGTTGYFSSVRPSGLGEDDLYRVDLLASAQTEETASMAGSGALAPDGTGASGTILIKGRVFDRNKQEGMEAVLELVDLTDPNRTASFTSDAATGEYMVVVPSGHDYAMSVRSGGYLMRSERVSNPAAEQTATGPMDITLQRIEAGQQEVLHNIFFEAGQPILDPASLAELGQVLALLHENPSLRLEIAAHVDNSGSEGQDDLLSEQRAAAVVAHLVDNGIPAPRLTAKGYGSSVPLAANDTEEHRAQNRRIEVRVL